ncbi:MAG: hypothetical protein AAF512_14440 [Pseudomonadota bacterium]
MNQRCWAITSTGERCENVREFLYAEAYCEYHAHLLKTAERQSKESRFEELLHAGEQLLDIYEQIFESYPLLNEFVRNALYALSSGERPPEKAIFGCCEVSPETVQHVLTGLVAYDVYSVEDLDDANLIVGSLEALANSAVMLLDDSHAVIDKPEMDKLLGSDMLEKLLLYSYEIRRLV